jgi:TLD
MENFHYCFCDKDGVGFGSDPHFGLFIDESLLKGSSHICKTYANGLLSDHEHFSIKELEVYGFVNF